MLKAILGYDIFPGLTPAEYDRWLWDVHVPDRLANPHIDRIVFNTVVGIVRGTRTFYRIAESQFKDMTSFELYQSWNDSHPIPLVRSSASRTKHVFNVLAADVDVDRDRMDEMIGKPEARIPSNYAQPAAKSILAYDVMPGLTIDAYDEWLWKIHVPDLLRNPFLQRIVFNTVIKKLRGEETFFRVAELHFHDIDGYEDFERWRGKNPVAVERSPKGRTDFRFYVLTSVEAADRESLRAR